MYQIDNDTASTSLPASTSEGTPGYFTDGNPATGLAATVLPAEFMNMVMMEMANLVTSAGLSLSKSDHTQVTQAVTALIATLATVNWSHVTDIPNTLVHTNAGEIPVFGGVELSAALPFIDFHYGSGSTDYNVRILNDGDGSLTIQTAAGALLTLNSTASAFTTPVTLSKTLTVAGNTTFNGSLAVKGAVTLNDAMTIAGKATFNGATEFSGAVKADATLEVVGKATLDGALSVAGATTLAGLRTTGQIVQLYGIQSMQSPDPTNAGNLHNWFFNYDGSERALVYVDSTGGWHWRSNGIDSMGLDSNKNLNILGGLNVGATATFAARPTFGGYTPWDNANLNPVRNNGAGNTINFAWTTSGLQLTVDTTGFGSLCYASNAPTFAAAYLSTCGGIGTYALARNTSGANIAGGSSVAGASLTLADQDENVNGVLTGTWRAMGWGTNDNVSLYMRIA